MKLRNLWKATVANAHPSRRRNSFILLALISLIAGVGSLGSPKGIASDEPWRPIGLSDLALKSPLVEPDADAEAIFWDVRVDDSKELVLSHYVRVKVFTKRGCEQEGKISISYSSGIKIRDIAARTIAPNGSITELANEDIFDRVLAEARKKNVRATSFAFPNLEPGAIIEYKWAEVISNASANGMRLQFQRDIPVQSIHYHIKPAHSSDAGLRVLAYNMPTPHFEKEENGFYGTTVTNMKAFHPEPLMPPEETVRSWAVINYTLASSEFAYTRLANRLYYGLQPFLKVDDDVKVKSAEIVAGASTPEEKLERISAFCRTNIKNINDKMSGVATEDIEKLKENKKPADTLNRGVGSPFDIDLLFAALANAAGFDARVAMLPDRSKTLFHKNNVVPGSLRPAIIAVVVGRAWQFFDPGFHYLTPGMLRWQEEGVDALITDAYPVWTRTPLSAPDKSKEVRVATLQLNEDGTLEGDIRVEYTGHFAVEQKEINEDDSPNQREETLKESLKRRLSTAELSKIVIENITDPIKPFVYRYHIRVPDYAQRTGKRIFLQPAFFEKGAPPVFSVSARKYPVYIHFPWSEDDTVTITLPKGYVIENADAPAPISAGRVTRYLAKIEVSKDASTIVYHRSFFFGGDDRLLIPAESYAQVKTLFDEVSKSDNYTIMLTPGGSGN
jgi:hypothetical protein